MKKTLIDSSLQFVYFWDSQSIQYHLVPLKTRYSIAMTKSLFSMRDCLVVGLNEIAFFSSSRFGRVGISLNKKIKLGS